MDIKILAVGKIKANYLKTAIAEYKTRLKPYVNLEIIEFPDEKAPENLSKAELLSVLQKEGEKILAKLPKDSHIISLCIEGRQMSSESFAEKIKTCENKGVKHLVLIIGGSNGLWEDVIKASNEKLSFSKMTFPHQLMRLILLEQIYRAYRINNNHPYHK